MKTIRVQNPEGVDEMSAYLLPDNDMSPEDFVNELKQNLAANGSNVYLIQTWDKDKEDKDSDWEIVAFMLAINYPNQKYVYIYQFWRDCERTSVALADSMVHRVVLWAENFGKKKLKMETLRDPEAFTRRWGFEPVSTVMEFNIPDDFEFPIYEGKPAEIFGKDKKDGTVQRTNLGTGGNRGSNRVSKPGGSKPNKKPVIGRSTADTAGTDGLLPKVSVRQPDAK